MFGLLGSDIVAFDKCFLFWRDFQSGCLRHVFIRDVLPRSESERVGPVCLVEVRNRDIFGGYSLEPVVKDDMVLRR